MNWIDSNLTLYKFELNWPTFQFNSIQSFELYETLPILGRLSRLQVVEIGGELNLAAKEAIFGGGSIMSWEVRQGES